MRFSRNFRYGMAVERRIHREHSVLEDCCTCDTVLVPRWIAWFYRLLPMHFNLNTTAWRADPLCFFANVAAPLWRIGLILRRNRSGIVIPAVLVESYPHFAFLPWGLRLYARLLRGDGA